MNVLCCLHSDENVIVAKSLWKNNFEKDKWQNTQGKSLEKKMQCQKLENVKIEMTTTKDMNQLLIWKSMACEVQR